MKAAHRVATAGLATTAGVLMLLTLKPHDGSPLQAPTPTPTPTPGDSTPGTATGTFTGDTIDTPYGPVQVAVTLDHGRLTDVRVLQTPSDNARDRQIAAYAVPQLTREALAAQSAHIDSVSGASYTSAGYVDSLQSALDQAGA
jgi:uncharacterized protein with FMN-binding domain